MITFKQIGDFSKLTKYLERVKEAARISCLDKYGRMGVEALAAATPKDSGKTAQSWEYRIEHSKSGYSLSFYNTNYNDGVPIAIILQYGHGTRNGGWVEGQDYINPAIEPIFKKLANEAWEEVTKL